VALRHRRQPSNDYGPPRRMALWKPRGALVSGGYRLAACKPL